MRVCSSILLIATIGLAPGSGLAQDNLPAAPSATREQRKPQSPPAADPAKTDNSAQQEQSNVAPKPADVSAASRTSSGPTADEDAATTIRVPVNEVNVIFTVTDKHGRYVKNLKKSDFNVVDDSKPAKEIRSFRNETDLPLQVGLLVDASNSVRDRFKFEQEAAIEFLNQIINSIAASCSNLKRSRTERSEEHTSELQSANISYAVFCLNCLRPTYTLFPYTTLFRSAKEIRSFRNETDLPLQVGLLVDASNSVRDRFKFEQEAAIEFLNQIINSIAASCSNLKRSRTE